MKEVLNKSSESNLNFLNSANDITKQPLFYPILFIVFGIAFGILVSILLTMYK